ncbi:hypothetical protein TCON_0595 [Astathelohania contejeani]|uniref:Uncharacterized protein n=1 Tax=Astathelohania contejeani TaxID=164912 RepID=A0ABQ7I198_9MICR|nr:hypothetical protein TCON_0595 [Thelohania contejeani]
MKSKKAHDNNTELKPERRKNTTFYSVKYRRISYEEYIELERKRYKEFIKQKWEEVKALGGEWIGKEFDKNINKHEPSSDSKLDSKAKHCTNPKDMPEKMENNTQTLQISHKEEENKTKKQIVSDNNIQEDVIPNIASQFKIDVEINIPLTQKNENLKNNEFNVIPTVDKICKDISYDAIELKISNKNQNGFISSIKNLVSAVAMFFCNKNIKIMARRITDNTNLNSDISSDLNNDRFHTENLKNTHR